ncbi:MAG: NnrS family protein, partial [Gammaproteobacteria bacterium]
MVLEARVTLGHTGRSVLAPRRLIGLALGLLVAAALVRIALPIVAPDNYAAS